ncbi:ATP-dependent RNA helicase DDX25 [Galendromus occidentalis]|uniref:RNA helicase n=1 Tax=Galendromus occidentalis TaxID=34638 RepID=A0AAJ6QXL8_9ACAR|nr:ATP-dependent RNA helicase DDX25 [Galendromus occidentalis]
MDPLRDLRTALQSGEYEVERSGDARSSVQTVTNFADLGINDDLYRAICKMGFRNPSRIQETALPILMENPPTNMMAQSQSGTGKTAAFLLAALTRVKAENQWPQVLIILPTLELAEQIATQCRQMLQFTSGIEVRHAVRGEVLPRRLTLREQVVIGTPGKLADWALRREHFDIKKIRVFVLDEADVMMSEKGHYVACINIHRRLDADNCQMLLFSATFDAAVITLADAIIKEPFVKITLRTEELALGNISHYYMHTRSEKEKLEAISTLYQLHNIGQAIIFCRTRASAFRIAGLMRELGQKVASLHGELEPSERLAIIEGFRRGNQKVLTTTNVCARGIDILSVTLVINYDLPLSSDGQADIEIYYHRVGRTGRFGRHGTAVDFINPTNLMEVAALKQIERELRIEARFIDHESFESVTSMEPSH